MPAPGANVTQRTKQQGVVEYTDYSNMEVAAVISVHDETLVIDRPGVINRMQSWTWNYRKELFLLGLFIAGKFSTTLDGQRRGRGAPGPARSSRGRERYTLRD